jgi:hypothetical protein
MGMFDWVQFEMDCPVCKSKVNSFQTKDGPCHGERVSIHSITNWYGECYKCKTWLNCELIPAKIQVTKGHGWDAELLTEYPVELDYKIL